MKYLFVLLFITLQACSSVPGQRHESIPPVKHEDVIVFGDSICADLNVLPFMVFPAWPTILDELSTVNVESYCIPGVQLSEYKFEAKFLKAGTAYRYAVINLGINDIMKGKSLDATMELYQSALDYIGSQGIEPVCFVYDNYRIEILALSVAITELCTERDLLLIHSAPETFDGVHLTSTAQYDTAVDAWRILFPRKY